MKGYLTDPYFSLTQMLNFSWQASLLSLGKTFSLSGNQRWHHVEHDHLASCYPHGLSLQKVSNYQHQTIVHFFFARSIPSGKKKSRFDKVFNEQEHFKGL